MREKETSWPRSIGRTTITIIALTFERRHACREEEEEEEESYEKRKKGGRVETFTLTRKSYYRGELRGRGRRI